MRSEKGIRGRRKYNLRFGMVLLDANGEVFWKEEGLKFSRSKVKSKLDSLMDNDDT